MMQLITCIIIETESLNWMHVDYSISNSIIITQQLQHIVDWETVYIA